MTLSALILSLALQTQANDKPTVQYYQETFEIRFRRNVVKVPVKIGAEIGPRFLAFRKNDAFAVWDERGLTIRRGDKAISTHLPEIPVSPKAFPREEILKTIGRIRSGECTKEAAGLSGAKRIGKDVYFLARWEDKDGKPWAEALVQTDLNAEKPRSQFLGRFVGLSSATKQIDDKLMVVHGQLAVFTHTHDSWGISTYDPATKEFKTQPIGATLVSFSPLGQNQALFVETSLYGTTIAGRVDTDTGTRKILYEGREQVRFLDVFSPEIVLASSGTKTKLVNCVTGAVRVIPYSIDARRVVDDILLWSKPDDPSAAWLMSPEGWSTLATWRAGQQQN